MGEEGSWQQEVRRKAKSEREGVKKKIEKPGVSPPSTWGIGVVRRRELGEEKAEEGPEEEQTLSSHFS